MAKLYVIFHSIYRVDTSKSCHGNILMYETIVDSCLRQVKICGILVLANRRVTEMTVLGVALRASQLRNSSAAVLSAEGYALDISSFGNNTQLLEIAEHWKPELIAIGSPLSLPAGLDCLEPSCKCELESPEMKGRRAELELATVRISCFLTNKSSIVPSLIYRGIELHAQLRKLGYHVIEVYPHATKLIVFGDSVPRKRYALPFLREQLPELIRGLEPHVGSLDSGACDALMNAYTGVLYRKGQTLSLGDREEGLIIVPQHGQNPIVTA